MKNIDLSYFLEEYLRNRPPFLTVIRAKEAWLYQKYLPLKKPVLDVGCGDGFFAKLALGGAEIGLDLAKSRMDESGGVYKKLVKYDGVKIPLAKNSAGTVVCNSVLEHVEHLDKVIDEIFRVLKLGGYLICPVMAKPWEDSLMNLAPYKKWMRRKQIHLNLLTRDEWRNKFRKFKLVEEIGHLTPKTCKTIELLHYWSIPNLILYKLTGRWTWNNWYFLPWKKKILEELKRNVAPSQSGAIFYVWQKPTGDNLAKNRKRKYW